jgi:hypothetical protein
LKNQVVFEDIRELVTALPPADDSTSRICKLIPGDSGMAVGKTHTSQYELLFIGSQIHPVSRLLRECITFGEWQHEVSRESFFANSLALPEGEHGASICAFIVTEFSRVDQSLTLTERFLLFEKFLEQFFRKEMLTEEETIGLIGELYILEALLSSAAPDKLEATLNAWQGYQHVSRDFSFGANSIEVKTTRRDESIHSVSNVFQIEARTDVAGAPLEQLHLISLGLLKSSINTGTPGVTLASSCDAILARLDQSPIDAARLRKTFLLITAQYGTSKHRSYIHDEMFDSALATQPWNFTFIRIYNMQDSMLSLPRRATLNSYRDLVSDTFQFTVHLPLRVNGDLNPTTDLEFFCNQIIQSYTPECG